MANAAMVGGNVRYPSLQSIGDLFRVFINDTFNNTTGVGTGTGNQAGLIMPNLNPDLLVIMDSAIQELYSDLRNVGDPELILDNYILTGLPALSVADPTVQVALAYAGFFDGYMWWPDWTLPVGVSKLLGLWERQSGTTFDFQPMRAATFGIGGGLQGNYMGCYEMREGMVWMPGALQSVDLRIRARITYPVPLYSTQINFATAYVPILDSRNAIVAKMKVTYAQRFAPELYPTCVQEETRLMGKLRMEVVRQMQSQENSRASWGDEATQDFAMTWSWL